MKKAMLLLTLILPLVAACSPISAGKSISRAQELIREASAIGADKKCPYEFTSAVMSLDYARTREGRSEFEAAIEFARRAIKMAEEAKRKAALIEDGDQARMDQGVTE